jgi:anti-sigma-K factor RskA
MTTPADGLDDIGSQEPPPDDLVAAEYVLGVLDAGRRLAAEARIVSDRAFADLVSAWQGRLAPLALELEPQEVPGRIWTRIQERLGWPAAGAAPVAVAAPDAGAGRSLFFWRLTAGLAACAALALLAVDLRPRGQAPTGSEAQFSGVTTLARDDGSPGWLATVDPRRGTVLMVPVPSAPDAQGRAAELWLIPPGEAPRSLGSVPVDRAQTVAVPATWRADLTGRALLAITLEPAAGIPHAAPTGPIIAKGAIQL